MPRLQITIVQGRDLAGAAEDNDLYAKIKVCAQKQILGLESAAVLKKYKTCRVANSRDPVWMETFTIGIPAPSQRKFSPLSLEVVDYHRFSPNSVVGQTRIDISALRRGEEIAQWLKIQADGKSNGEVFVRVLALDFNGSRSAPDAPAYSFDPGSPWLPMYSPSPSSESPVRYNRPPAYEETESPAPSVSSSLDLEPMLNQASSAPAQNVAALVAQIVELLPDVCPDHAEAALKAHHCSFERAIDAILSQQDRPQQQEANSTAASPVGGLEQPRGLGQSGRRRALLIGCRYRHSPHCLSSPPNDVQQVHRMLQLAGFERSPDTTVVLMEGAPREESQPTKANIVAQVRWLVAEARDGDSLFFHFSGHSVQIPTAAGYEEGLAAQDCGQGGVLREKELAELLIQPLGPGVRLTALIDTPHGGGQGLQLPVRWLDGPGTSRFRHGIFGLRPFFGSALHTETPADVQLFSVDDQGVENTEVGYSCPVGALSSAFVGCMIEGMSDMTPPSYRLLLSSLRRATKSHGFSCRVVLHCSQLLDPDTMFHLEHYSNAALPEPELLAAVPTKPASEREMGALLGSVLVVPGVPVEEDSFRAMWAAEEGRDAVRTEEWESSECSSSSDSTPMIMGAAGEPEQVAQLLADRIADLLDEAGIQGEAGEPSEDASPGEDVWSVTGSIATQMQQEKAEDQQGCEASASKVSEELEGQEDSDAEVDLTLELAPASNQVDSVLADATPGEEGDEELDLDVELAMFFGST